jgi:hypothetical protein
MAVLAGTDFFTVEVLTLRGLAMYHVLFLIHPDLRSTKAWRKLSFTSGNWTSLAGILQRE